MKKLLAMLLAAAMIFSMVACSGNTDNTNDSNNVVENNDPVVDSNTDPVEPSEPAAEPVSELEALTQYWAWLDEMDYDEQSDALYQANLGEFYEYYSVAKAEKDDVNKRMALMAIAEAKLMEAGVMLPVYGDGGNYAMSRVVPRSLTTTSWGIDEYRWYTYLVTNELIYNTDRDALIALWGAAETADDYFVAAKAYLEEHGYTLNDTWNYSTSYQLETWDVIATSYTSDSYFIACTYSPLLEYDAKNVQQPALATSYEVSDDGLTYTFHIREGVKWVDSQGREVGEVTANDWVTSMMHLIDNNDALGYLMTASEGCGIKNYDAYINGDITDFSLVGVEAVDDYTLVYTLEDKFPAFASMMGYGCFAPLNYDYYKSQGGTFGVEGDEYTAGNFGTTPDNIAYCGAYLVTNYTENNITAYKANPTYWNADAVNIHAINFYYNDGSDVLRSYNECKDNVVAAVGFNSSALVKAKEEIPEGETDTYFNLYNYTTTNSATTYMGWNNLHRGSFANFNDNSVGISTKAEDTLQQLRTMTAMNNANFRAALNMAFDRGSFNAVTVGEELKYARLKNSYVTGAFMVLTEDVTVEINGTATTFPAGTYFGEIEQAQLDADGFPITVWDPTADSGAGSGDGFDGWFNVDNAVAYLEKAIAELTEIGMEISAENPIHIDVPYGAYSEQVTNRVNVFKQCIENNLNGIVVVDLVAFDDNTSYTYSYYRCSTGNESNYDVAPGTSGWGPDYGDAQSFLDTVQPYGYMTKQIGLY